MIEAVGPAAPQNGAMYPNTTFCKELRDVANIIRSGMGLEIATVDLGGWDTHADQGVGGGATLQQGARLAEISGGIRGFYIDLGPIEYCVPWPSLSACKIRVSGG